MPFCKILGKTYDFGKQFVSKCRGSGCGGEGRGDVVVLMMPGTTYVFWVTPLHVLRFYARMCSVADLHRK